MRSTHFIVAIGADKQHIAFVRITHEELYHSQRRRVGPLQVVEKHHQWMSGRRKDLDEALEHAVQAILRFDRRQRGHRPGGAGNQRQFRYQLHHEAEIGAQRLCQHVVPLPQLLGRLTQQLPYQFLERLDQRRIRHVAPVLVELAGHKTAAPRNDRLVDFIDDCRLAYPGITGDQQHLAGSGGGPFESAQHGFDFPFAPIQLLRNHELAAVVGLADGRAMRPRRVLHQYPAQFQISLQAVQALVTVFGVLFQKPLQYRQQRPRQAVERRQQPVRRARNMAMHQLHRISGSKWRLPCQQFIKRRSDCVIVCPVVNNAVHAPGLLRRHIKQRALQRVRIVYALDLLPQFAGNAEIDQLQPAQPAVPDQVGWIDVFVDDGVGVDYLQRRTELQCDVKKVGQRNRSLHCRSARARFAFT